MKAAAYFLALAFLLAPLNCASSARADDVPMQEQQAKMDASVPVVPPSPILNGKVSASEAAGTPVDPSSTTPNQGGDDRSAIFGRAAQFLTPAQMDAFRKALNGRTKRDSFSLMLKDDAEMQNLKGQQPKYSNEQFRQMEYGVVGFISTVAIGAANPIVTEVFPGCPGAMAGIKVGDLLVSAGSHVFRMGDGQRTVWQTVCGKAGTTIDMKVLRDGELLTFNLVRMNFEDIPDASRRAMYEMYLSRYGPPTAEQQ